MRRSWPLPGEIRSHSLSSARRLPLTNNLTSVDCKRSRRSWLQRIDQRSIQPPRSSPSASGTQRSYARRCSARSGRTDDTRVADIVLKVYPESEPDLQPKMIELLTQRPAWAKPLLESIGRQEVSANALNVNQVQKLLASRDKDLVALVSAKWGAVRTQRNPQREQVVADVRKLLQQKHGDARQGEAVFKKVCAQCHKIYGEGQDVGPDITVNGRGSFDQLLSNVLDPSLVIGAGYQARLVTTTDGRALTGLLVEDSPQRVLLKEQGGKLDTIPRRSRFSHRQQALADARGLGKAAH